MPKQLWTEDQVRNLKDRQACRYLHPYTCSCGAGPLFPTRNGWKCKKCGYRQDWAHKEDLDGGFKRLDPARYYETTTE